MGTTIKISSIHSNPNDIIIEQENLIIQPMAEDKAITLSTISHNLLKPRTFKGNVRFWVKELLAITCWIYAAMKLFVFDLDTYLLSHFFPSYTWILSLKFVFFVGLLALAWWTFKNKLFFVWSSYLFFYPFLFFLWRIPLSIARRKSWIVALAYINAIISFLRLARYNFIVFAVIVVSSAIVINATYIGFLWPAFIVVMILTFALYVHKFMAIFKPSNVYEIHGVIFAGVKDQITTSCVVEDDLKTLPVEAYSDKQLENRTKNLQTLVLYNRVCLYTARKLKDYQGSGLNIVAYVLTVLILIALTVYNFAIGNMAVYKIDPQNFLTIASPSFFDFFYYSFNGLVFNGIDNIKPISVLAKTLQMVEWCFALFLIVIFVTVLLSVRTQRHAEDLGTFIAEVEEQGLRMEQFIRDEYQVTTISDAVLELRKFKAKFIEFIYKLSEGIPDR